MYVNGEFLAEEKIKMDVLFDRHGTSTGPVPHQHFHGVGFMESILHGSWQ